MRPIHSQFYGKPLKKSFDDHLTVDSDGDYLIEITASAQNWWQNTKIGRSFIKKDSLTLRIDSKAIITPSQTKKLLASDFWNGNILKGSEQTFYIVLHLQKGKTSISFISHGTPFLKEIKLYLISNSRFELTNLRSSKRDRMPWITFLIMETVFLKSISITASAGIFEGDDDDLQLRIDEKKQLNKDKKSHHNWYWCGKILKGTQATFTRNFADNQLIKRIDIDADGTPIVDSIKIELEKKDTFFSFPMPRLYKPGTRGENYNSYDRAIGKAVHFWNSEFLNKKQPVPNPLDPSLIKAIAYVESRLGFGEDSVGYSPYPDIMQVGDERNPAIHVLRNKKGFEEREWDDGKKRSTVLKFDKAVTVQKPEDSIYWAVRWLYHKAQYIQDNERKWKTWDHAVEGYHLKGDKRYRDRVMNIFRRGSDRSTPLWALLIMASMLAFGAWGAFAAIHDSGGTQLDGMYHILKNGTYRIDDRAIRLDDGFWVFTQEFDETAEKSINPYDSFDGPYYIRYASGTQGDLNADGIQDAIVVLGTNYGGTGYYIHLAALLFQEDGTYRHAASYTLEDRDVVRAVSIHNGVISIDALLHAVDDPYCCPSLTVTKQLTLLDFQ